MVQLMKLREFSKVTYTKVLVHGPSGSGKTRMAGTCAKIGKTLFADAEGGVLPIASLYPDSDYVKIESDQDFRDVYNKLFSKEWKFDWFVIDSLTEINRRIVDEVASEGDGTPDKGDWNVIQARLMKYIRYVRDLPMNVLVTCLSQFKEDQEKVSMWMPMLTGKMIFQAPGFFDIVGFMRVMDMGTSYEYKMVTRQSNRHIAKDRSDSLEPMEEPDMQVVMQKVKAKLAAEKTAVVVSEKSEKGGAKENSHPKPAA